MPPLSGRPKSDMRTLSAAAPLESNGFPLQAQAYYNDGYARQAMSLQSYTRLPMACGEPESPKKLDARSLRASDEARARFPAAEKPTQWQSGKLGEQDAMTTLIRGIEEIKNQHQDAVFDADAKRHKLRAVSFDNYALVSALIFGFCTMVVKWSYKDYLKYSTVGSSGDDVQAASTWENFGVFEFAYLLHLCIMASAAGISMYSTMVFALHGVYTRTAIATGRIEGLTAFLAEMQPQRDCAFKAFIAAAAFLPCDIIMCMYVNLLTYGYRHYVIAIALIPVAGIAIMSMVHVLKLLKSAGRNIFGPPPSKEPPLSDNEASLDGIDSDGSDGVAPRGSGWC